MNVPLKFGKMFYVAGHRTASSLNNISYTGKERREEINSGSDWRRKKKVPWTRQNHTVQYYTIQNVTRIFAVSFSIYLRNNGLSSSVKKVTAFPVCPALPVRPVKQI